MTKKIEVSNIYAYLAYKYAIALLALLLAQVFFYLCNTDIFHVEGFGSWIRLLWGNIVFGTAAVGCFLLPWAALTMLVGNWVRKKGLRIAQELLYVLGVVVLIGSTCGDAAYFEHTYRRISSEIFAYLGIGGQMGSLIPLFIRDYWFVALGLLMSLGPWAWLNSRITLGRRNALSKPAYEVAGMLVAIPIYLILMRGSFKAEPLSLRDAARYCDTRNSALVVNSAHSVLLTSLEEHLQPRSYMSDEEAQRLFNPEFESLRHQQLAKADSLTRDSLLHNPAERRNIVILMVESLSQEYMGCYNNGTSPSYTPFLDELAQRSKVYQGRSNGKKSIESVPAVCASIPTLMEMPVVMSKYSDNDLEGLPVILKRHGYHSMVFHGGYNGTMDFDKFCYKIGVDEYLGMDEYLAAGGSMENYDNTWGIYDEPFLQYMTETLSKEQEPFFSLCFTVTSHHPFPIPETYKGVFPKGPHKIVECIGYTDNALRRFFESAQKCSWYDNTIFIIIGDHPGYLLNKEWSREGLYKIPMLMFDPRSNEHFVSNQIVQQIDLMPTIIDLLGLDETCVCFGNSLLQRNHSGYQIAFGNGFHLLDYNGGTAYLEGDHEEGDPQQVKLLKAIVQQYNDRMINNRLK